jgi:hypothetical protein
MIFDAFWRCQIPSCVPIRRAQQSPQLSPTLCLNQLSYSCGEDIETVSDAIALWCNSHPKIEEELITAYSQLPETKSQPLLEQVRPFGGKVEPLQPSDQNEMLVTTLKNKMRKVPESSETNSDSPQTTDSQSQLDTSPKN